MNLKYVCKNDGYIIDRKLKADNENADNTFKTKGTMILKEILPQDEQVKKNIIEYAFDSMKQDVLDSFKKKYFLNDEELVTFYFEGRIENDNNKEMYAIVNDDKIPMYETNFNLDFEVEGKVTSKNFLKLQYNNLKNMVQNI